MRRRLACLSFIAMVVFAGCRSPQQGAAPAATTAPSFDQWADTLANEWVRSSPQMATRMKYFPAGEQATLDQQLSLIGEWDYPYGAAAFGARSRIAQGGLDALATFDAASLSPEQRTSAAVIRWTLEDQKAAAGFPHHRYVFDQFNGLQLDLINHLTQSHPIQTPSDVQHYLTRLGLVAARVDQGIAEARAAAGEGIVMPRFIIQRVIDQIDGFLKGAPRENVFVASLESRIGAMSPAMPAADRMAAVTAAEKTVSDGVIPAYRRIRGLLAEQLKTATDDAGVWRLPRGDAYYAHQLAAYTTTTMTADEIHALGLKEVARIEGEMDRILKQFGYTTGSVNERFAKFDESLQPNASPDPRPTLLADYEMYVRDAERRSASLFDLRPKAPVVVRREPAFSEKTAAAHYNDPTPDGSRPGVFYVPLPGPVYEMLSARSLSYHEAVPGHHFQIALQQEVPTLPRYRRLGIFGSNSAYVEGWALYAERLADENGWYEGDPRGRLGYLQSMLFRARRLVVDTGIHAKHWTRQQAIDYGIDPTEVERYVAWPGQACAYMVGQLKIVELRERARTALGPRFDIKEFHNVVLQSGSVPLDVLSQIVDAWIASKKG
jgi:uncharacterized protein (DUF885 family)